jgi:LysR family transcriptional regulator for bpeEF and oprC
MEYQSGRALEELAAFVAVVEANGFSAAARSSGARKATLSRRVQELEGRLGVSLLARTTRSLRLTEEGRAYLAHAQRSLSAARDAEEVVALAKSKPTGHLRVTTSGSLAGALLEPVVAEYLERYPAVTIELDTSVRRMDLVREGFDLAIRVGPLADSTLVARRLGIATGGYYAGRRYLKRRGTPRRPEDLERHATIVVPQKERAMEWPFVDGKRKFRCLVTPRFSVTSFEIAARAAAADLGVVRTPRYFVEALLERRRLVQVLEPFTPKGIDVYAVYPPGGMLVPKTRVFVEMVSAFFDANERTL